MSGYDAYWAAQQADIKFRKMQEIIEGCRLGGISLEQRLSAIDGSSIERYQQEAEMIKSYLKTAR